MTGTTNLNLTKPTVGGDSDVWGTEINADLDTLDALLQGVINGLTLSAAGATATFGIAAGAASGMTLVSAYTKTASAWAVGTANGSLDTGTIANGTWYHVWEIMRPDTGVVDILTSLSATAPTMPANYTFKRRIGAMKTDGSAQWVKFSQLGNDFIWAAAVADQSGATPAQNTETFYTLSVPPGVKVVARVRGIYSAASGGQAALLTSPDETNTNAFAGDVTVRVVTAGTYNSFVADIRTNTSAQIRFNGNDPSNSIYITTYGWIDPRGQF